MIARSTDFVDKLVEIGEVSHEKRDDPVKDALLLACAYEKQCAAAEEIILALDEYGEKYGCANNSMNDLFIKTEAYIRKYELKGGPNHGRR